VSLKLAHGHQTYPITEQLEQIADAIVNDGHHNVALGPGYIREYVSQNCKRKLMPKSKSHS
jgi:hypothetical protein